MAAISSFSSPNLLVSSLGISEFTSLKEECPAMPSFISQDQLRILARYLDTNLTPGKIFPEYLCRNYSLRLFFVLTLLYEGRYEEGGKTWRMKVSDDGRSASFQQETGKVWRIKINGREASLQFVRNYDYARLEHCFLVLRFVSKDTADTSSSSTVDTSSSQEEEWIIDPTWKQFAGQYQYIQNRYVFDPKTSYNKSLKEDCPDILIAKRSDFDFLFRRLEKQLLAVGDQECSRRVSCRSNTWERDADNLDGEFDNLLPEIADSNSSYIDMASWEALQRELGVDWGSPQTCAQKLLGALKPFVPERLELKDGYVKV